MNVWRKLAVGAALVCALIVGSTAAQKSAAPRRPATFLAAPARPKLVVILVVDQMRADYVQRFHSEWHGGLARLVDHGAWLA